MPELPEVETVRRTLHECVVGLKTEQISFSYLVRLEHTTKPKLTQALEFAAITDIKRRGKYLIFHLSNQYCFIVHLGMTGKLLFHVEQTERLKHDHLVLSFNNASMLVFNDARRFGKISLVHSKEIAIHPYFANLGFEYDDPALDTNLSDILRKKKTCIKSVLLDQSVITGIGNIYDCEILFDARISPSKPGNCLTTLEIRKLIKSIRKILNMAINLGGSSIKDYIDGTGHKGKMQEYLKVYDRENQKCYRCKSTIQRTQTQGRSTWFCGKCQK